MRWEARPALRTVEFFERVTAAGPRDGFLEEFAEEIRFT